jgi:hypothetical protein
MLLECSAKERQTDLPPSEENLLCCVNKSQAQTFQQPAKLWGLLRCARAGRPLLSRRHVLG